MQPNYQLRAELEERCEINAKKLEEMNRWIAEQTEERDKLLKAHEGCRTYLASLPLESEEAKADGVSSQKDLVLKYLADGKHVSCVGLRRSYQAEIGGKPPKTFPYNTIYSMKKKGTIVQDEDGLYCLSQPSKLNANTPASVEVDEVNARA